MNYNNEEFNRIYREVTDVVEIIEIIRNRLYFMVIKSSDPYIHQSSVSPYHYFTTDDLLVYQNYHKDFGPVNLGRLYTFCQLLHYKLTLLELEKKKIIYFTAFKANKRCNAAFLIAAYSVAFLDRSPNEALEPLLSTSYPYKSFQDANMIDPSVLHTITLKHCICALNKAFYLNFVDFSDFDISEFELYEGTNNTDVTDLSWIVPAKLAAFAGPCGEHHLECPVERYVGYFRRKGITTVVRLNESLYDPRRFTRHGIEHFELYFPDGSTPSLNIVRDFFAIVESNKGGVAVHCKAGLGRTGCLIGAYLIKHYGLSACEAIAWMRICRPGCVIRHQQTWLEDMEARFEEDGKIFRAHYNGHGDIVKISHLGIYSIQEKIEKLKSYGHVDDPAAIAPSYDPITLKIRNKIKRKYTKRDREANETQGDYLIKAKAATMSKKNKVKL